MINKSEYIYAYVGIYECPTFSYALSAIDVFLFCSQARMLEALSIEYFITFIRSLPYQTINGHTMTANEHFFWNIS